jgi:CRISPR-associated protein Cmr3
MSIWIIEPHEPLIFRDGRPFSSNPGASANSLPFPFPSTTTGGARMQAGLDEHGTFVRSPKEVRRLKARGPLLVQLPMNSSEPENLEWLFPAPADAILFKAGHKKEESEQDAVKAELRRLVPLNIGKALTDLSTLSRTAKFEQSLLPVGLPKIAAKEKPVPQSQVPAYWNWSTFEKWLLHPQECSIHNWEKLGIHSLQSEQRVHITFDKDLRAARDEALFETNGREFIARSEDQSNLGKARQLALAVLVNDDANDDNKKKLAPQTGFATLGGERRIVDWHLCSNTVEPPVCSSDLIDQVARDKACRILLLTPAYFTHGCYPDAASLRQPECDVTPELRALVVERHHVVSGWDFEHKRPKQTRRLAPAGTVFFLKLHGTPDAIKQWIQATWLQCIGDDPQYRDDGFGLAVVGTWNGIPQEMESKKKQ